jgi:hypothetical protein
VSVAALLPRYAVVVEVGEDGVIGFPAVGKPGGYAEVTGSVDGWVSSRSAMPALATTMQACLCREVRTQSRPASR